MFYRYLLLSSREVCSLQNSAASIFNLFRINIWVKYLFLTYDTSLDIHLPLCVCFVKQSNPAGFHSVGCASLTSSVQAVSRTLCWLQQLLPLCISVYLPNNFKSVFWSFCPNSVKPVVATLHSHVLSASENQLAQSIQLNANLAVDAVAVVSVFRNKWRVRCLCSFVQWCLPVFITYRGEVHWIIPAKV